MVLIQALLLMTYWHESPENPNDSQHWLNVCWSLGVLIGLDCDPSTSPMTPQCQKIWKRLWWCLYTRDTLLALNLRRPLCYGQVDDSQLPLVSLEDFNIGYPPLSLNLNTLSLQGKRLTGGICYLKRDFEEVLALQESGRLPAEEMITSVVPLSDVIEGGFEELMVHKAKHVKILIQPAFSH